MKVSEALESRISVRAFSPKKVPVETITSVLKRASRSPSGGNLQPWRMVVLSGEKLEAFTTLMEKKLANKGHSESEASEYAVYPPKLKEPYRSVRFEVGEQMYSLLGISRDERPKRLDWFANNFQFFGAPAAVFCFVDRIMGPPQWSDLGMYLQSVMLLFQEEGIDTCAQECWAAYPKTVHKFCSMPEDLMLFCGMAIGYRDETHPVNKLRTDRMDTNDWLKVL
ncbi:MAG: nitroreductase [Pseudomonadota bacterium]